MKASHMMSKPSTIHLLIPINSRQVVSKWSLQEYSNIQIYFHKMMNLEVALGSFWQLARHWKQGESAKLELSCEDGNLQLQLSASLGHPDSIHFTDPGSAPSPHV